MSRVLSQYLFSFLTVLFLSGSLFATNDSAPETSENREILATVKLSTHIPEINLGKDNFQVNVKPGKSRFRLKSEKYHYQHLSIFYPASSKFSSIHQGRYDDPFQILMLYCILRI
jgi:hypothetical protein